MYSKYEYTPQNGYYPYYGSLSIIDFESLL